MNKTSCLCASYDGHVAYVWSAVIYRRLKFNSNRKFIFIELFLKMSEEKPAYMFNFNYDGMQGRPYRLKYTYMSKGGWFQTNDIYLLENYDVFIVIDHKTK